jgi:SPP1 family predicted phage head-tail adaptor
MRAGRLDRRVTIQSRTLTRNDYGEQIETWADDDTVWGERFDLRGREFFTARQVSADVTTRFRLRYRTGLTVLHRLVCEDVTYDIHQVSEIGRRQGLEILASAKL